MINNIEAVSGVKVNKVTYNEHIEGKITGTELMNILYNN